MPTLDHRRRDVVLDATYQIDHVLRLLVQQFAHDEDGPLLRGMLLRVIALNGAIMEWASCDDDIGVMEGIVFGGPQEKNEGVKA